jgi:lactoylglutathione lyase
MIQSNNMKYLHTMVRISDVYQSLVFYCQKLGLFEITRKENKAGRFTLIFLGAPEDVRLGAGQTPAPPK